MAKICPIKKEGKSVGRGNIRKTKQKKSINKHNNSDNNNNIIYSTIENYVILKGIIIVIIPFYCPSGTTSVYGVRH